MIVLVMIELNLIGVELVVMVVGDKEGVGMYLMSWGDSVDVVKISILLEVFGLIIKYVKKYMIIFIWILIDIFVNVGN